MFHTATSLIIACSPQCTSLAMRLRRNSFGRTPRERWVLKTATQSALTDCALSCSSEEEIAFAYLQVRCLVDRGMGARSSRLYAS